MTFFFTYCWENSRTPIGVGGLTRWWTLPPRMNYTFLSPTFLSICRVQVTLKLSWESWMKQKETLNFITLSFRFMSYWAEKLLWIDRNLNKIQHTFFVSSMPSLSNASSSNLMWSEQIPTFSRRTCHLRMFSRYNSLNGELIFAKQNAPKYTRAPHKIFATG